MLKSCDSGSAPFEGDFAKFLEGMNSFRDNLVNESTEYFESKIVKSYVDKILVNIEVPNYPQFRDMNEMFLSMIDGIEKINTGYIETDSLSLKLHICKIPELLAIEKNSKQIYEKSNESFEVRVCLTGPYTLASFFPYKDQQIFTRLGNIISELLEHNLFKSKHGKTSLVSIDEPLFGLIDDPLIDFGTEGRENLRKAWDTIFHKAKSNDVQTMIHLHSTANPLFWDLKYLAVIDSHVSDPILQMKNTFEMLQSKDKFLKASITVNDFDLLIKNTVIADSSNLSDSDINEKIADIWDDIRNGTINPLIFLETIETMNMRLDKIVERFGKDRILYSGPECGLKGYPTYDNAIACLRRVARATENFRKKWNTSL